MTTDKSIKEITDHMIAVHGNSVLAARDWADAHACGNIGRNPAAVEHWDAVSKELTRRHMER